MWKYSALDRIAIASIGSCAKRPNARSAALAARPFLVSLRAGRNSQLSKSARWDRCNASCSAARSILGQLSSKKSAMTAIRGIRPFTCAVLLSSWRGYWPAGFLRVRERPWHESASPPRGGDLRCDTVRAGLGPSKGGPNKQPARSLAPRGRPAPHQIDESNAGSRRNRSPPRQRRTPLPRLEYVRTALSSVTSYVKGARARRSPKASCPRDHG